MKQPLFFSKPFCFIVIVSLSFSCKKDKDLTTNTVATLTTKSASSVTCSSIKTGGDVNTDGGSSVMEKGVCWSTSPNPTTNDSCTSDGANLGSFSSNIVGLEANTIYYIKAYAINDVGTAYGSEITVSTLPIAVGNSFKGGFIAYILQVGDPGYDPNNLHGLIIAPDPVYGFWDEFNGIEMSGADETAIGSGMQNTIDIVNNGSQYSAAQYCYDYTNSLYDDWFLPSKDELSAINSNYTILYDSSIIFYTQFWYSSSEFDSSNVWMQWMGSSGSTPQLSGKNGNRWARSTRYF